MTDEREKALNDLGFVWARGYVGIDRDSSNLEERWNRHLEGECIAKKCCYGYQSVHLLFYQTHKYPASIFLTKKCFTNI